MDCKTFVSRERLSLAMLSCLAHTLLRCCRLCCRVRHSGDITRFSRFGTLRFRRSWWRLKWQTCVTREKQENRRLEMPHAKSNTKSSERPILLTCPAINVWRRWRDIFLTLFSRYVLQLPDMLPLATCPISRQTTSLLILQLKILSQLSFMIPTTGKKRRTITHWDDTSRKSRYDLPDAILFASLC